MSNRKPNTRQNGEKFLEEDRNKVWEKAEKISGKNPHKFRKDRCGATIEFEQYGNKFSGYGWEIDHIIPVSKGGDDELSNLQPLHRENNAAKSDDPDIPSEYCKVKN